MKAVGGRRQAQTQAPDWPGILQKLAHSARDPRLQRFYQAGTVAADTPLAQVPLLAMDVETTGLDLERDSIVSIGLVPLSLNRIRCTEARYWLVKPAAELRSESVTFHHITHSAVRDAPRLDSILDELLAAMAGKVMVVHYRTLERGFLDQAIRHLLGEGLYFPVIDTMQLEARLHRGKQSAGWLARLSRQQRVSIRLADSRLRYGLPLYQAHHALTDALATAELLQAQVAHHYSADTAVEKLWV